MATATSRVSDTLDDPPSRAPVGRAMNLIGGQVFQRRVRDTCVSPDGVQAAFRQELTLKASQVSPAWPTTYQLELAGAHGSAFPLGDGPVGLEVAPVLVGPVGIHLFVACKLGYVNLYLGAEK